MHIILGTFLFFVAVLATYNGYYNNDPRVVPVVDFVFWLVIIFGGIAVAGFLGWNQYLENERSRKLKSYNDTIADARRKQEKATEAYEQMQLDLARLAESETERLYALANTTYPDALAFTELVGNKLKSAIAEAELPDPDHLWEPMLRATRYIYDNTLPNPTTLSPPPMHYGILPKTRWEIWFNKPTYIFPFDPEPHLELQMQYKPFAEFAEKFDLEVYANTFVKAFMAYLRAYPKRIEQAQFTIPITNMMDVKMLVSEMTAPFGQLEFTNPVFQHSQDGAKAAWAEFGGRGEPLIYASKYPGDPERIPTLYLHPMLQPLFWEEIPWGLTDHARTQHHRALGAPGSGKTTFLSHFILHDFPKVIKDQASLVVLDSQRLARHLSKLELFAEGHPFHDKIIIADPNPDYPLALNPFRITRNGQPDLDAGVAILAYALGGMTEDGTTDLQEAALGWIIRGAAYHPEASLDILKEFFRPAPARQRRSYPFPELYPRLDHDTRFYFDVAYPEVRPATLSGLLQRLMSLPPVLNRMLNASTCNLDLFNEFQQGGKILLVDTDQSQLSEQAREVFGRLFIAMLKQVVDRRGSYDEHQLKHVFVVIDEAHDYIRTDQNFGSMLVKARNKRVCLTVAHHNDGQILNPQTKRSLQDDVFIRSFCTSEEAADGTPIPQPARIETGPPERPRVRTVPFKKLDWTREPFKQMSNTQYHELRQRISEKYGDTRPPSPQAQNAEATSEF